MARHRLTVDQAAANLGISTDAVRKRARRGSLESEKDSDGTVYIFLDDGTPRPDYGASSQGRGASDSGPNGLTLLREHLDFAQAQVEYLQNTLEARDRELAEMRRLLAGALERIPQRLHPPPDASPEPRESPETT